MTTDPRAEHAVCDRALQAANDQLETLRTKHQALERKHTLLVRTAEGLRVYENELDAMRLRGEPVQRGFALAVQAVITALTA